MDRNGDAPSKRRLEVAPLANEEDETCRTFVMHEEDHTLGNALRYIINKNPEVEFCGYSVPHPSENKINFRIQTKESPAVEVFQKGLKDLYKCCEHISSTFESSVEYYMNTSGRAAPMETDST